MSDDGQAIH
jgi:hypothetical protein